MKKTLTLSLSFLALSACTQQHAAPVDFKGAQFYGKEKLAEVELALAEKRGQALTYIAQNNPFNSRSAAPVEMAYNSRVTQNQAISYNSNYQQPYSYNNYAPAAGGAVSPSASQLQEVQSRELAPLVANQQPQQLTPYTQEYTQEYTVGEPGEPVVLRLDAPKALASHYIWPVHGRIVKAYGEGQGDYADGINIAAPQGEPVYATADGEVAYAGDSLKDFGDMVLIKHKDSTNSMYAHMGRIIVSARDRVRQGDIIGYVGATGAVRDPQLHFALREGKAPMNPESRLSRNVASR